MAQKSLAERLRGQAQAANVGIGESIIRGIKKGLKAKEEKRKKKKKKKKNRQVNLVDELGDMNDANRQKLF